MNIVTPATQLGGASPLRAGLRSWTFRPPSIILGRRGSTAAAVGFRAPPQEPGPVRENDDDLVLDDGQGHTLIIGPTGSGKTRYIGMANCLWFSGSLFALDL